MSSKHYTLYPYRVESMYEVKIEEHLSVEALMAMIMNFECDGI